MKIKFLNNNFSVCSVKDFSQINFEDDFVFASKTDEEYSLVCESEKVPENTIKQSDRWCAFKIEGILDFSLTGILYKISKIMAEAEIGIFAVSTYNTDYVLIKNENKEKAKELLKNSGYEIAA